MPKKITSVTWSATSVPSGVSFNAQTGTFSGTPEVEGTYTVPVHVETNYGEDTKDVVIEVEASGYEVYAIGKHSSNWGTGATDSYGFRKVDMPLVKKLSGIPGGFAAKTTGGDWYVASLWPIPAGDGYESVAADAEVKKYPSDDSTAEIAELVGGVAMKSGTTQPYECVLVRRDTDGTVYEYCYGMITESSVTWPHYPVDEDPLYTTKVFAAKEIQQDFGAGVAILKADGVFSSRLPKSSSVSYTMPLSKAAIDDIRKIATFSYHQQNEGFLYMTSTGELWENNNRVAPELGAIKDFWLDPSYDVHEMPFSPLYVLTVDNKLYARGNNYKYWLGLPEWNPYADFTEVGEFNVKKISPPFMLTVDGKLYHTGGPMMGSYYDTLTGSSIERDVHQGFTHVFPEYTFHDIAVAPYANTLIVTKR